MDEHPSTNAEFRRFVKATGYVTVAERPPEGRDYPDADPTLLVPGSLVFGQPPHRVSLDDSAPGGRNATSLVDNDLLHVARATVLAERPKEANSSLVAEAPKCGRARSSGAAASSRICVTKTSLAVLDSRRLVQALRLLRMVGRLDQYTSWRCCSSGAAWPRPHANAGLQRGCGESRSHTAGGAPAALGRRGRPVTGGSSGVRTPVSCECGVALARLGRIPRPGDRFAWRGQQFEVVDMDRRRVDKVLALPPACAERRSPSWSRGTSP